MKITIPILSFLALSGALSAATLTGISSGFSTAALPSVTGSDWGYFSPGSGNAASVVANNTSNSGSNLFTVTPAGIATSIRGSGTNSDSSFTYTNGESPLAANAATPQKVGGVFSSLVGSGGIGSGVQLSLTSFTIPTQINLYTYVFRSAGTMRVYLNNGTTPLYSSAVSDTTGAKTGFLFSFDFVPDLASDTLRFEFLMDSVSTTAGNLGFQAISTAPIPEPSALALIGLCGAAGLLRRRR